MLNYWSIGADTCFTSSLFPFPTIYACMTYVMILSQCLLQFVKTIVVKIFLSLDQSRGYGIATKKRLSNCHLSSRVPETESSDGSGAHPPENQSFFSQGIGLQLAPPTQRLPVVSSYGSSETDHTTPHVSETRDKDHTWLGTNQTFPSLDPSHGELRSNISSTAGQIFDKASQYGMLGNIPQAFTSGFPFSRIHSQNQNLANLGGQVANTQPANVAFTASMNQTDEYCEKAQTSQSELASAQDMSQLSAIDEDRLRDPAIQI